MTLGQGSLKRSPWWCWAVMLAATLTLLPGAAFVANAKDKTKTISFASNGVRNLMQRLDKLEWTFGLLHLDVVHDHRLEDSPPPSARDTPEKSNSTGRQ